MTFEQPQDNREAEIEKALDNAEEVLKKPFATMSLEEKQEFMKQLAERENIPFSFQQVEPRKEFDENKFVEEDAGINPLYRDAQERARGE